MKSTGFQGHEARPPQASGGQVRSTDHDAQREHGSKMSKQSVELHSLLLFAAFVAGSLGVSAAFAQSASAASQPQPSAPSPAPSPAPPVPSTRGTSAASRQVSRYAPTRLSPHAQRYYELTWGVDILGVKPVSSGQMLRFTYRVVDAEKAKPFTDKRQTAYLYDQKTRARLDVPNMEKVGQLRQAGTPENGREYWMMFSNKNNFVKRGGRVDVVIGNIRVVGLVVE
jgi:hypothetical protein